MQMTLLEEVSSEAKPFLKWAGGKSQLLKEYRQYVFQTINDANKSEVKKAIEQIYNVKVEKVRMLEMPAKKRRAGATFGKKSGYKKAVVTLKEGYQIEVIPQK